MERAYIEESASRPRSPKIMVKDHSENSRPLAELEGLSKEHFTRNPKHRTEEIDKILANIINTGISPNKAFKMASRITDCEDCRKAVRWIAVMARNYGKEPAKRFVEEDLWKFPKKPNQGGEHD